MYVFKCNCSLYDYSLAADTSAQKWLLYANQAKLIHFSARVNAKLANINTGLQLLHHTQTQIKRRLRAEPCRRVRAVSLCRFHAGLQWSKTSSVKYRCLQAPARRAAAANEVRFADLIASTTPLRLCLTNPKVSELSGIIALQICPEVPPLHPLSLPTCPTNVILVHANAHENQYLSWGTPY